MSSATTQQTIRRVLLTVFILAETLGVGGVHLVLRQQGIADAERQSRLILASAKALRDYTAAKVLPVAQGDADGAFHDITVPSFAAHSVFRHLGDGDQGYTYRESALNPTNPRDRATPFEVDLVRRFEAKPSLKELTGLTSAAGEPAFYVAHPFRIDDAQCLTCHSTPQAAPPTLVAKYGGGNGFHWAMGETVGVQLLTVPVATQFRGVLRIVGLLSGGLLLVFVAAYFALAHALDSRLVGPLRALTAAADAASRSVDPPMDLPKTGAREVTDLAAAIERLRLSLRKALSRLGAAAPDA